MSYPKPDAKSKSEYFNKTRQSVAVQRDGASRLVGQYPS